VKGALSKMHKAIVKERRIVGFKEKSKHGPCPCTTIPTIPLSIWVVHWATLSKVVWVLVFLRVVKELILWETLAFSRSCPK